MQPKLTASLLLFCYVILCSFGLPYRSTAFVDESERGRQIMQALTFPVKTFNELERPMRLTLAVTKQGRTIEAFYFPGKRDKRALIIGGMHGSELSSIAVARNVVNQLYQDTSNYYSVLILPSLFPDNAAMAIQNAEHIGTVKNIGRYSNDQSPDPNRQMPPLGKAYDATNPIDYVGRTIEKENQVLLHVIQTFHPDRILNIHAIKDVKKAGIFADPRTDASGRSLGFTSDSSLAVAMASYIQSKGGCVLGNQLTTNPTALYHSDHKAAPVGTLQKRNLVGSTLAQNRGFGVSLGSWATTAVESDNEARKAIRLLTMEFPGCKRPEDYKDTVSKIWCQQEMNNYMLSIVEVFLKNFYEE